MDKRQGDFNRLVDLANKRFDAHHAYMQYHFLTIPETDTSNEMKITYTGEYVDGRPVTKRVDTPMPIDGTWVPEWMLAVVAYEREWRSEANRGIADPAHHDEIVEVLHKGLLGDMETVDAFLCLKELATEAKRAVTGRIGHN